MAKFSKSNQPGRAAAPTATEAKAEAAVRAAEAITVDAAVAKLTQAKLEIQKQLGAVEATVTNQLTVLDTVNAAVTAKQEALKALYDIEATATSLAELRAAIEGEKLAHEEAKADDAKAKKRAEDEYDYQTKVRRRDAEDKWAATFAAKDKLLVDREKAVAAIEQELNALRKQVADFPAEVDKAVKKAEAALGNVLRKDFEHEKAILAKNGEILLSQTKNDLAAANAKATALGDEVARLRTDLSAAQAAVKELGGKALESQSGRASLEAVQRAMETQASSSTKTR